MEVGVGLGVYAVGDNGDLEARHQGLERGSVRLGDCQDAVSTATDERFVAPQPPPLDEGVGSARPAGWGGQVGEERPLLQQVLAVMVIEHDEGTRLAPAWKCRCWVGLDDVEIGGHLDSLDLHDVERLPRQPARQPVRKGCRRQAQRHVRQGGDEHVAQPVAECAHRGGDSLDVADGPQRRGRFRGLVKSQKREDGDLVPCGQAGDEPPITQCRALLGWIRHLRRQEQNLQPSSSFLICSLLPDTPPTSPAPPVPK